MSATIDKIALDAKRPGVQLEHALTNYYESIKSKNPNFKCPSIKCISSTKLEKSAVDDAKKIMELKANYNEAKRKGDKAEADKFKSEFKALKDKKSKAQADVIDLNDLEFVRNFDKEFVETKKDEALTTHISDPELRGLIDILSQKIDVPKQPKQTKEQKEQEVAKVDKAELQRQRIKKILKSLGLEVHNSHLSTASKRFKDRLDDMKWFRTKTFNELFKPVLSKNGTTKRYLSGLVVCNDFDKVFEQYIKGVSKEDIIAKLSSNKFALEHYAEEKPDLSKFTKEEKEEIKKEMNNLKLVNTTYGFISLHDKDDLKAHFFEYQEVMQKVGRIIGATYNTENANELVKSVVKVSQELNAVKTFEKQDKDGKIKETKLGDLFVKDLLQDIPIKISTGLRKKILTAITQNSEIELTEEDVAPFENYDGGMTNPATFENLASVSDSDLKNLKCVRQAIGIKLFVESLRKIDKMIIAHGGKYGFKATIYY